MAADRVRIIQFCCQQREILLYHVSIVSEFSMLTFLQRRKIKMKMAFLKYLSLHIQLF